MDVQRATMPLATAAANTLEGSAERLPIDFLRSLFQRLSAGDLCAAACTCRLWYQLTGELWRAKVEQRWRHGSNPRWRSLEKHGMWKQLYRERHLRDIATRTALRDLPWPVRREASLASLVATGDEALDELLAAAAAATATATPPPSPPSPHPGPAGCLQEPAAVASGSPAEEAERCWRSPQRFLGQRYWAEMALAALQNQQAQSLLRELMTGDPRVAENLLEAGALAIAQAHYPTADLRAVELEVEALGQELRRRIQAAAAPPGSVQALRILNHLLFAAPESSPHRLPAAAATTTTATTTTASTASATAAPTPTPTSTSTPTPTPTTVTYSPILVKLAGAQGGVGLRGCDPDDYYNPSNSLLCDVLARRRGIPISLAVLHVAVAQWGGLEGRLELIGLPTRVVNRFVPKARERSPSSPPPANRVGVGIAGGGGGGAGGAGGVQEGEEAEEVFIDVYAGGTLLSWTQMCFRMAGLGVSVQRSHVRALTPAQIFDRMLTNLYHIYWNKGATTCLRMALGLCGGGAVCDQSLDILLLRYRISTTLEDWGDAARCLEVMMEAVTAVLPPQQQQQYGGECRTGSSEADSLTAVAAEVANMSEHMREGLAARLSEMRRDLDDRRTKWQSSWVMQKHRPPAVLFSVGTMVQHRMCGYRGVIVDWDPTCRAEETWIKRMGVDKLQGGGRQQPFYKVLVSGPSGSSSAVSGGAAPGGADGSSRGSRGAGASGAGAEYNDDDDDAAAVAARPSSGAWPQVWRPTGRGCRLRGLHNQPEALETYVAQVNLQVLLPVHNPQQHPLTAACEECTALQTAATAAAATGRPVLPRGPRSGVHLAAMGVTFVEVPYDFKVEHPELGLYFQSKLPGEPTYRLNAAMRHRFPADAAGACGGSEQGEGDGDGNAEDWDWMSGDARWREG